MVASRCCAPARRSNSLKPDNEDQKVGIQIVRKALQTPARQIFTNSGEDGSVIVGKILENAQYAYGYNAQTHEYGDLYKQGVIDPTKVVRCALQDAASVAGLLDHDGSDDRRHPEEGWPCAWRTRRRNGRHGRHGLLRSLCPAPCNSPSSSRPQGTEIGKPRKICGAFFVSSILAPGLRRRSQRCFTRANLNL